MFNQILLAILRLAHRRMAVVQVIGGLLNAGRMIVQMRRRVTAVRMLVRLARMVMIMMQMSMRLGEWRWCLIQ